MTMRTPTPSGKGAPYFVILPKDVFISSGENARFSVECEGRPIPRGETLMLLPSSIFLIN